MSTKTEVTATSSLDWLKWLVVVALVGGAVYGNWYFQEQPLLYRVAGVLVIAVIAFFALIQTQWGSTAWGLMKDARSEIRRVVWPTRTETTQTTLVVLVLVLVFALILWLLDSGLSWLVSTVIG
ncbi:MAG: preprotein translocase subunit SecE [Pseudomonadales bacterium]